LIVGGLLTAITLMVDVTGALGSAPSLPIHVTVRASVEGVIEVLLYVTERKAA